MPPEEKMNKRNIACLSIFTFLFGIFAAGEQWNVLLILFLLSIVCAFLFIKRSYLRKTIFFFFIFMILGTIYFLGYARWISAHTHMPQGKQQAFFGIITEEPKRAGNFMMFPLKLSHPYVGMVDIFTYIGSKFHYGDLIWVKGTVDASNDPDEYLAVFSPQTNVVTSHNGLVIKEWSIAAKDFVAQTFARFFSSDRSALLTGIILGTTSTLSGAIKQQMDASGTSYIVGMYGYKIAILGTFLVTILKDRLPRKMILFLVFGVIWSFVFISGASISALRAGFMGSLTVLAQAMGRLSRARDMLLFTAFIMVLIDPRILIKPAFQLSFLSFLGIYYLGPPINNMFHWTDGGWLQWKEHAMLSLSTNIAIVPLVMNTFGGFSLTSFISNILIMIPWSVAIFFGMVIFVLGTISPALAFFAIQLENIFLSYELLIIKIFSIVVIPIPNIFNSTIAIYFYYGLLIIFIYYYGETTEAH